MPDPVERADAADPGLAGPWFADPGLSPRASRPYHPGDERRRGDLVRALAGGGDAAGDAERYGRRAEAEQAATAMLIRQPELPFVEIAECGTRGGEAMAPAVVGRISPSQPPAPDAAEIDDLHKLPRGAPEQ